MSLMDLFTGCGQRKEENWHKSMKFKGKRDINRMNTVEG